MAADLLLVGWGKQHSTKGGGQARERAGMNSREEFLLDKCRLLETALKAASARCAWRLAGICELGCRARSFCDVKDPEVIRREERR